MRRGDFSHPVARCARYGFTLIELLVVVAIIALLISILLPSMSRAREVARITRCASNLRQQGLAANMYAQTYKGWLPPYSSGAGGLDTGLVVTHWTRWFRTGNTWQNLGKLYATKYITDGPNFYCPSQKNPTFKLETYEPWPTDYWPGGTAAVGVRVAYNFNPVVKDPASGKSYRKFDMAQDLKPQRVFGTDLLESAVTIAHDDNPDSPGWNVMFGDTSVSFKLTREPLTLMQTDPGNFPGDNFPLYDQALQALERTQ
ncbi:MAG: prepilin-type N-terminal cleavage/methylation domain-containing protein [Planctomycetes bacterium]|nr:prepilin-type N-terminal cleavage/methylation domain-containing protein [Planctomycetota bacterium]